MAVYIYLVQMDVPADKEADFNRIYDTQHVPELSKVPGVRRVRSARLPERMDRTGPRPSTTGS